MDRQAIFAVTAAVIVLWLLSLFLINIISQQNADIASLEKTVDGYYTRISELESKAMVVCNDTMMKIPSGREYLSMSATADEEGRVTLRIDNLREEPHTVLNIREVLVGYDRDAFVADERTAPTFKNSTGATCRGTVDPGDHILCFSDYYEDDVNEAVQSGNNAFIIKYIKADFDVEPYTLLGENLCVKL